jgi:hypothetical protein
MTIEDVKIQRDFAQGKLAEAQKDKNEFNAEAWHGYIQALNWVIERMTKSMRCNCEVCRVVG